MPRGVKRKMSNFPLRPRERTTTERRDYHPAVLGPLSEPQEPLT